MPDNTTVPELFFKRARSTPDAIALKRVGGDGSWCPVTWAEYRRCVSRVARTLVERGLVPGDVVGILGVSRAEWDIAQFAILACGGTVVGLDIYDTADHLNEMVNRSDLTGLIVLDEESLALFGDTARQRFRFILLLGDVDQSADECVRPWDGKRGIGEQLDEETTLVNRASADDRVFIIFTSGTTGAPKGIAYTHRQVCLAVESTLSAFDDIQAGDHFVCWLPLSNLFQRMVNFCAMVSGAITYYVEDPRQVGKAFAIINPHVFVGVPRFYEKLYHGIMEQIDRLPAWRRRLVQWALDAGDACARSKHSGTKASVMMGLRCAVAERLVLMRLRASLGSNLRYFVSGSAPMPRWLLERFHAMGLLVLESYGLSENIVPMATNRPDAFKFGTVGQPLVYNEIRTDADGQLLVRGPGVFDGYLGEGDKYRNLDANGFYPTGDFGTIDTQGYITLKGRTGDIIKTSTGRKIAAVAVEQSIGAMIAYVEHAIVVGANRKYLVAIVSVSESGLEKRLCANSQPASTDFLRQTRQAVSTDVAHALEHLAPYQRPVGILVTNQPFTPAGGELTSNQKLRRKAIEDKYAHHIDELYAELEHVSTSGPNHAALHVVILKT